MHVANSTNLLGLTSGTAYAMTVCVERLMSDRDVRPLAPGIDEQILAEHNRIHELNDELQSSIDVRDLLACIAELRAFLVRHFAVEEEAGGFFDTVRDSAPRYHAKIEQLQREHAMLLQDLDALAARCSACLGAVAAVHGDARALSIRLSAHEHAEDSVLIDTMYTDIGEED